MKVRRHHNNTGRRQAVNGSLARSARRMAKRLGVPTGQGCTAKQEVLQNYPQAFAHSWADCWIIYTPHSFRGNVAIGRAASQGLAWKDALNHGPDTSKR